MRNGATQPVAVGRSTWYAHARFRESTQPQPPLLEPFLAQQDTLPNRSSTDQVQKSPPGSRPSSRSPPNKRQRRIRDSEDDDDVSGGGGGLGSTEQPVPENVRSNEHGNESDADLDIYVRSRPATPTVAPRVRPAEPPNWRMTPIPPEPLNQQNDGDVHDNNVDPRTPDELPDIHPGDQHHLNEYNDIDIIATLEELRIAQAFISALQDASLEQEDDGLDIEAKRRLKDPITEPIALDESPSLRAGIDIFLDTTNA
ncbi:hypothetical protein BDZ97DRAFT_1791147 [Flammula alnicola]|nr:hypothetical protein BDZ97DRAFT_1791121 [Flammula alnicola]KAF8970392.1 hypothetical protein BDZ97DRAFT_1791147 [Flammula alnicola]